MRYSLLLVVLLCGCATQIAYMDTLKGWFKSDNGSPVESLREFVDDNTRDKAINAALCVLIPINCFKGSFTGSGDEKSEAIDELMEGEDKGSFLKTIVNKILEYDDSLEASE